MRVIIFVLASFCGIGKIEGKMLFTFLGDLVFRGKGVNFAGESGSGFAI